MRVVLAAMIVWLAAGMPAHAGKQGVRIRAVISAQIEAFRKDDGDAAFAIAAPDIQAKFRDPATFLAMVAAAYPQVYRPREVVFLDLVETDGRLVQRVLVTGPDGRVVLALYDMLRIDGEWRINGCILATAPEKEI